MGVWYSTFQTTLLLGNYCTKDGPCFREICQKEKRSNVTLKWAHLPMTLRLATIQDWLKDLQTCTSQVLRLVFTRYELLSSLIFVTDRRTLRLTTLNCTLSREWFLTNMKNRLVYHLIGTKLCCALSKCMSVQNYIVNLDLHVCCQRSLVVHNTGRWCKTQLCTIELVHNVGSTNPTDRRTIRGAYGPKVQIARVGSNI